MADTLAPIITVTYTLPHPFSLWSLHDPPLSLTL